MGTPRASASVDQMRNVQRTASCGGEAVSPCASDRRKEIKTAGSSRINTGSSGASIVIDDGLETDGEVGCVGFCRGNTHDFIVAQHLVHFICTAAGMLKAQVCAGVCGARMSPNTNKSAIASRLITSIGSTWRAARRLNRIERA